MAAAFPTGRATMAPALEDAANYHAWVHSWVAPYLRGGRLLDVGSGTANHLQHLDQDEVVSVDIDRAVIEELRQRYGHSRPRWRFEALDIADPASVDRLGRGSFDIVWSSNVFEHIENDAAVFRAAGELLKPGGRLVLLLPAHQALYGSIDRIAGHHRRYDRALLRARFAAAGFAEEVIRYVNLFGAVGWLINNRLVNHRDIASKNIEVQVRLFDRVLVPLLRRLEGTRHLPFGQSVVAVGRKTAEPRPASLP